MPLSLWGRESRVARFRGFNASSSLKEKQKKKGVLLYTPSAQRTGKQKDRELPFVPHRVNFCGVASEAPSGHTFPRVCPGSSLGNSRPSSLSMWFCLMWLFLGVLSPSPSCPCAEGSVLQHRVPWMREKNVGRDVHCSLVLIPEPVGRTNKIVSPGWSARLFLLFTQCAVMQHIL